MSTELSQFKIKLWAKYIDRYGFMNISRLTIHSAADFKNCRRALSLDEHNSSFHQQSFNAIHLKQNHCTRWVRRDRLSYPVVPSTSAAVLNRSWLSLKMKHNTTTYSRCHKEREKSFILLSLPVPFTFASDASCNWRELYVSVCVCSIDPPYATCIRRLYGCLCCGLCSTKTLDEKGVSELIAHLDTSLEWSSSSLNNKRGTDWTKPSVTLAEAAAKRVKTSY